MRDFKYKADVHPIRLTLTQGIQFLNVVLSRISVEICRKDVLKNITNRKGVSFIPLSLGLIGLTFASKMQFSQVGICWQYFKSNKIKQLMHFVFVMKKKQPFK